MTTHLTLDWFDVPVRFLVEEEHISWMIETLVKGSGAKPVAKPLIHYFPPEPPYWLEGQTGVVLLSESHITYHTWPEDNCIYMDVFSCKPFDADAIIIKFATKYGNEEFYQERLNRTLAKDHYGLYPRHERPGSPDVVKALYRSPTVVGDWVKTKVDLSDED